MVVDVVIVGVVAVVAVVVVDVVVIVAVVVVMVVYVSVPNWLLWEPTILVAWGVAVCVKVCACMHVYGFKNSLMSISGTGIS